MSIYKGLADRNTLVRVTDSRVRVALVNDKIMEIEFPEDVLTAFVQATNWFPGDRIKLEAITVYTSRSRPRILTFERLPRNGGATSVGFLSFEVDTMTAELSNYREHKADEA